MKHFATTVGLIVGTLILIQYVASFKMLQGIKSPSYFSLQDDDLPEHGTDSTDTPSNQRVTNLWLLACETRQSEALRIWTFTALRVQELAANDAQVNVKVQNLCEGVAWRGFGTKIKAVDKFLNEFVKESINADHPEDDIVMFTDSDAFFNPEAVSARDAIGKFHEARKGKPILFSAEPNCWNGSFCNQWVIAELFPGVTRSHCPQFLNSGQYMGDPKSLLDMIQSEEMSVMKDETHMDDQQELQKWYSKNMDIAQLDVHSSVFRNLITGTVDSRHGAVESTPYHFSCGPEEAARNCSKFIAPYAGSTNSSSLFVEMVPVPNCTVSIHPFSIHGAGMTKGISENMGKELMSQYERLNITVH